MSADPSSLDLDKVLSYLVVRVGDASKRVFTEEMAIVGLSGRQFAILVHVADEGGLAQAELARRLHVTPQSIGTQIETLVTRGLLSRRDPAGRGHAAALDLTDEGARSLHAATARARDLEARTTAHLDTAGRQRLEADLRSMLELLED